MKYINRTTISKTLLHIFTSLSVYCCKFLKIRENFSYRINFFTIHLSNLQGTTFGNYSIEVFKVLRRFGNKNFIFMFELIENGQTRNHGSKLVLNKFFLFIIAGCAQARCSKNRNGMIEHKKQILKPINYRISASMLFYSLWAGINDARVLLDMFLHCMASS